MEIYLLIILAVAAWFWFNSISARDLAIHKGRDLAERMQLQLLDETVACTKLRLARNSRGQVQLLRTFEFDVSPNGTDRLECNLVLLGNQLQTWHIPPYQQPHLYVVH